MFSCILASTSSWLSEPPLTPMRTGLPWSIATLQMVENCSSRRLPVPTLPGLMRYLSSAAAQSGIARQQQVAVVVEVADERRRAAGVEHPLLDLGHGRRRFGQVHRDAHHLRSGLGQLDALLRRGRRVGRVGHRHRLHDDRRAAADLDVADAHADGAVEAGGTPWLRLQAPVYRSAKRRSTTTQRLSSRPRTRMLWMCSARARASSIDVVVLGAVHLAVEEPGDGGAVGPGNTVACAVFGRASCRHTAPVGVRNRAGSIESLPVCTAPGPPVPQ